MMHTVGYSTLLVKEPLCLSASEILAPWIAVFGGVLEVFAHGDLSIDDI
jgi:hypothetical protein